MLNSNMFPEFLYHPRFSLQVKGLESSAPGLFFSAVGAMKNSRISSPRKIVSCFAMLFVPLWTLSHEYNPDQWRWFIDSSKVSLKLVLLHNGNRFPSVHLTYAVNMKENYESAKLLLGKIKYDEFNWELCGDLKLWHCYMESNSVTQNTAVSCASGTSGTRRIAIEINCGLNEHH